MPKPQESQALLKLKAVVVAPEDVDGKGHKLSLIVTAHQLWLSEGRGLEVADIQSVKLTASSTIAVRMIGRPKPYEIRCRSEDEARQLRACLVFQAKYTRGGIPGVEDWRQLLDKAYDAVDISATAMPSGAALSRTGYMPIPGKPGQGGQGSGSRKKLILVGILALVLVVAGFVVYQATRGPNAGDNAATLAKLVQLGDEAFDRHDFKLALSQYQQALPLSPQSPEINSRIGECLMAQNNFAEAAGYFLTAVYKDDWQHPEYSVHLAHSYNMANQPDKTLAFLTPKTRGNLPADVGISYELAFAFDKRGRTSEALTALEKAYREHPERADVVQLYISLLIKANRLKDAAAAHLAVARRQKTAEAYLKAIAATGKTGDLKAAEALIAEAHLQLPNDPSLKRNPSDILTSLGIAVPKPPAPPPLPVPVTSESAAPSLPPEPVTGESATTATPPEVVPPSTGESAAPPTTSTVPVPPETAVTPGVAPPETAAPATTDSAVPPATTEAPAVPPTP